MPLNLPKDDLGWAPLVWQWPDRQLILDGRKPKIAGILNVTPDSFSDGGLYWDKQKAVERGCRMAEEGADLIDLGGQSTRPGFHQAGPEEELRRVLPVLQDLLPRVKIPISIDTVHPEVAAAALAAGAHILNDESGGDRAMAEIAARSKAPVILMHWPKEKPQYGNVAKDVTASLAALVEEYEKAGVSPDRIVVDPGLGFAKNIEENLQMLAHVREMRSLGKPILIGASRKSFIGAVTGQKEPALRLPGSLAAAAWCALWQVELIRVHDVKETAETLAMFHAMLYA